MSIHSSGSQAGKVDGIDWARYGGNGNGINNGNGNSGNGSVPAPVIPISQGRRTKASFSNSPLAHPTTPIHRLASTFQSWLHIPDPKPLYAVVGALVANSMRGYPVWLMTIGPPSCGKTVLLNSLLCLDKVRAVNDLSGRAAFLSGVKEKDKANGADGGLLNEIGDRGCIVIPDFTTTILSLDPKEAKVITGVLRQVYDGSWGRDVGTDGHKHLPWSGRIGALAGCTDSIDDYLAVSSDMGERFILFRYPDSSGWAETSRAAGNPDPDVTRKAMALAVCEFAEEIDFDWYEEHEPRQLTRQEVGRLIALAQFTAAGRGTVKRDWRTREIINVLRAELPPRLFGQYAQLIRGMERCGISEDERWAVVCQIAINCMPRNRGKALMAVLSGKCSAVEVAVFLGVSLSEARRTLEDLQAHRLLDGAGGKWVVSDWCQERLELGWKGSGNQDGAELGRLLEGELNDSNRLEDV